MLQHMTTEWMQPVVHIGYLIGVVKLYPIDPQHHAWLHLHSTYSTLQSIWQQSVRMQKKQFNAPIQLHHFCLFSSLDADEKSRKPKQKLIRWSIPIREEY